MIGALVTFWSGLPKWLQTTLQIVGAGILLALAGKAFMDAVREEGARRQREKQEREEFKEQARLNETVTQIGQETEDAKDRALDAPSHVDDVSSADELRDRYPANAEVILRPREASSSKGPR